MADKKEVFLTAKGFTEIETELDELKRVKRPAIINAIKDVHPEYNCIITIDRDYH